MAEESDSPLGQGSSVDASLDRQRRLVDQMTTMHARLRDRARMQGVGLTVSVLVGSVVATAFAFAGSSTEVSMLGVSALRSTWLGWLAVIIFSVTLIDLVIDRRSQARAHQDAVERLADLGSCYRSSDRDPGELNSLYQEVVRQIPAVPERKFNRLKAAHLQKVEVSRLLSDCPGLSERQARKAVKSAAGRRLRLQSRAASPEGA